MFKVFVLHFHRAPKNREYYWTLHLSLGSLTRTVHKDSSFCLYKVKIVQELQPHDYINRVWLCNQMITLCAENYTVKDHIFMSVEAVFHDCNSMNELLQRCWSKADPRWLQERPLHSEMFVVWCEVSSQRTIGPFLFENTNTHSFTVNAERS